MNVTETLNNVAEWLYNMGITMLNGLYWISAYMSMPMGELMEVFQGNIHNNNEGLLQWLYEFIIDLATNLINRTALADVSLFAFVLGSGVLWYIMYAVISFFGNVFDKGKAILPF